MVNSIDLLRSMEIFAQVEDADLQKIAALLKEERVGKETTISRQGEPGDALYVVQSGRVKAVATDAVGRERTLSFYSDGQVFGEMALLTGEPWSTTMQTVADTRLLVLKKSDLDAFLGENIQLYLQMMKVIADLRAQATTRPPVAEAGMVARGTSSSRVFTVFSPKGGVGKSTVAVNLAVALARKYPDSVALLDLSLTFGHAPLLLNITPTSSLASTSADAMSRISVAEDFSHYLVVHEPSSLRLLAGSLRPEEGESVSGEATRAAIEQLKRYFTYVVVDTSSGFSDPVLAALEGSDRVVLLCSPEIVLLADLRQCQRIFNDVIHLPKEKTLYVMNNALPYKGLSKEQFEDALHQPLYMELPNGGDVPLKASLRGESFVLTQSGSSISKSIQKLASQLVVDTAPKAGPGSHQEKKWGLFGR